MFPAASFFALKTYFKPITFASEEASSILQVPAFFKVASFSSMAFSYSSQSGLHFASMSV